MTNSDGSWLDAGGGEIADDEACCCCPDPFETNLVAVISGLTSNGCVAYALPGDGGADLEDSMRVTSIVANATYTLPDYNDVSPPGPGYPPGPAWFYDHFNNGDMADIWYSLGCSGTPDLPGVGDELSIYVSCSLVEGVATFAVIVRFSFEGGSWTRTQLIGSGPLGSPISLSLEPGNQPPYDIPWLNLMSGGTITLTLP